MEKEEYIGKIYKRDIFQIDSIHTMFYIYQINTTRVWGDLDCVSLDLENNLIYTRDPYSLTEIKEDAVKLSNKYDFMKALLSMKSPEVMES